MELTKFLVKSELIKKTTEKKISHAGKTAGVVWQYSNNRAACVVQIDRSIGNVHLTVFDPEDNQGNSVTNVFEEIVTGVFMEHLSDVYSPNQMTFSHRTTLLSDPCAQFGVKQVALDWSEEAGRFVNPRWGKWIPDNQFSEDELDFLFTLSLKASVAAEAFMREEIVKNNLVTPKKEEIYKEYMARIAANGGKEKFSLRLPRV